MTGAGFPALCFAVDAVRETEYSLINVYLNICAVMATIKKFMKISGQMKNLQRSGWVYHKIENPESDAAHSWSLSLLVQLYAPAELDLCKCLKMANIHDLAEIYVGDLTPGSGIAPEKKHELETDAMRWLVKELDYP